MVIQEGGLKERKVVNLRKGLSGREVEVRSSENDKAVDSFFWGRARISDVVRWREQTGRSLKQKNTIKLPGIYYLGISLYCVFSIAVYKENKIIHTYKFL